jgi:hypothetical protein
VFFSILNEWPGYRGIAFGKYKLNNLQMGTYAFIVMLLAISLIIFHINIFFKSQYRNLSIVFYVSYLFILFVVSMEFILGFW